LAADRWFVDHEQNFISIEFNYPLLVYLMPMTLLNRIQAGDTHHLVLLRATAGLAPTGVLASLGGLLVASARSSRELVVAMGIWLWASAAAACLG